MTPNTDSQSVPMSQLSENIVSNDSQPMIMKGQGFTANSCRVLLGLLNLSRAAEAWAQQNTEENETTGIAKPLLKTLLNSINYRDENIVAHSRRVAQLAVGIAQQLGCDEAEMQEIELSALLHDLGKVGIPDSLLFKPGKLNPEEASLMGLGKEIANDILQACRARHSIIDTIHDSQSFYNGVLDGSRKLGERLGLPARILAIADAFDSLATDQVFRAAKSTVQILDILDSLAGTRFDANLVSALRRWVEENGVDFLKQVELTSGNLTARPQDVRAVLEATTLTQIFNYLYMMESMYDGFYLLNPDMRFVIWNQGMTRLTGLTAESTQHQLWTPRALRYADQYSKPLNDQDTPMRRVIESGRPITSTLRLQAQGRDWVEVEVQTLPILDNDGTLLGICEIFKNLSEQSEGSHRYRELKLQASRDALTGCANRGELENQMAHLMTDYKKHPRKKQFSMVFVDIDHFKSINDTYGHNIGDEVLVEVGRCLLHSCNSGELVARYGGEEFVCVYPECGIDHAFRQAERLRETLSKLRFENAPHLRITASFGVSEIESSDSLESLRKRADEALYLSKQNGRNQTTVLTSEIKKQMEEEQQGDEPEPATYDFHNTIEALINEDVIIYKLKGFVRDNGAKLVDVSSGKAVIQMGKSTFLGGWGATADQQPILMTITIGQTITKTASGVERKLINVDIEPRARSKTPEEFQERANNAYHMLKSYFSGS